MATPSSYEWYLSGGPGSGEDEDLPACAVFGSQLCKLEGALVVPAEGMIVQLREDGDAPQDILLPGPEIYWPTSEPSYLEALTEKFSTPATYATLDIYTETGVAGDFDLVIRHPVAGVIGNAVRVQAVGDAGVGAGASVLVTGNQVTLVYEGGVSTVEDVADAIDALVWPDDPLIEVVSVATRTTPSPLDSGGDSFEYTYLHGGNGGGTGTYTATVDDSDNGTGQVTITSTVAFSLTFSDEALRDALGFTGNVPASGYATTIVSPRHIPHLWLPNRRRCDPPAPDGVVGVPIANAVLHVAPSGDSFGIGHGVRRANSIEFRYLAGYKMWRALEQVPGESYENFWETVVARVRPVRYHLDRSNDDRWVQWLLDPTFAVAPMADSRYYVGRGCAGKDSRWSLGPLPVAENRAT